MERGTGGVLLLLPARVEEVTATLRLMQTMKRAR
jgi:hypothetical protein